MSDSRPDADVSRVTIVVPVYGHWPSLRDCVESLIDHADPAAFDVLLVNDCGPEADAIEAGLRGLVFGRPNFRYERNPENLGFVRNCNRAVLELDRSGNDILLLNSDTRVTAGSLEELRAVLHSSETIGVVCPRSNDATIASIPFHRRDQGERDAVRAYEVFTSVSDTLPRHYVAPVAIGFCFLIRRDLIDHYGLFDEVFGQGYNEENDFCLRLNQHGYSAVIANHAFVFHVGSTSFGSEQRAALEARNSVILHERYPFYPTSVVSFIQNDYAAVDRFADILVPHAPPRPPKVLFDLRHFTEASGAQMLHAIESLSPLLGDQGVEVTIAATATPPGLDLNRLGRRVIAPHTISELFDVGVTIAPPSDPEQLIALNRHCLRWAVAVPQATSAQSWEARSREPYAPMVEGLAAEYADASFSGGNSLLDTIETLLRSPIDRERLGARDDALRDLALLWEGARGPYAAAAAQLEGVRAGGAYRIAQRISRLAAPARRLLRG